MFVSDTRLNISKGDDDIQDQAENRPHLTSTNNHCIKKKKKNKFMVTNKKKKKKKKKDVSFRESYSTSDHRSSGGAGGGGGGNIDFNKPTKVLFFPFNNPNKFLYKKSSPFSPSSSSSSTAAVSGNACFPGKISRPIFFCFKQPPTLESSSTSATLQSQTSDPNNPNFTFDQLKSLIEHNDFFSKQCNPHSL